jgi:hypothetical protein
MESYSRFIYIFVFIVILSATSIAKPNVSLLNEHVYFISDKKIEVVGDVVFSNLYNRNQCLVGLKNWWSEGNIYFEYIDSNGKFKTIWLDLEYDVSHIKPYVYSDGLLYDKPIFTNQPQGEGDYIYPVTDTNRGSYLIEPPSYSEECKLYSSKDEGKIFHFDKIFTIYDIYPIPSNEYRLFVELENCISSDGGSSVCYYVRDFYGPNDVSAKNTATGIARYYPSKGTIMIPFLDLSNLGGKIGDTAWLELKVKTENGDLKLVLDTLKGKGGFGKNTNLDIADRAQMATYFSDNREILIPFLDIGDGNSYWIRLKLESVKGSEFVFDLNTYGVNQYDFSNSIGQICASDAGFVRSLYQSILDRDLEVRYKEGYGLSHLKSLANGTSRESLILVFFNSLEYQNKHKSDVEFIRDAYQAILEREPTNAEKQIDDIIVREDFLKQLFNSEEYLNLLSSCYQIGVDKVLELNSKSHYSYSIVNDNLTSRPDFDANYD